MLGVKKGSDVRAGSDSDHESSSPSVVIERSNVYPERGSREPRDAPSSRSYLAETDRPNPPEAPRGNWVSRKLRCCCPCLFSSDRSPSPPPHINEMVPLLSSNIERDNRSPPSTPVARRREDVPIPRSGTPSYRHREIKIHDPEELKCLPKELQSIVLTMVLNSLELKFVESQSSQNYFDFLSDEMERDWTQLEHVEVKWLTKDQYYKISDKAVNKYNWAFRYVKKAALSRAQFCSILEKASGVKLGNGEWFHYEPPENDAATESSEEFFFCYRRKRKQE